MEYTGQTNVYPEIGFPDIEFRDEFVQTRDFASPVSRESIEDEMALQAELENQAMLEQAMPKQGPTIGIIALAALAAWGILS